MNACTVKICVGCGMNYRPTSNRQKRCSVCRKVYKREDNKRRCREWRQENLKEVKRKDRERGIEKRARNPEAHREYHKKWYQKNQERRITRTSKWQRENPEKVRAYSKKWKHANLEKSRIRDRYRRANDLNYRIKKQLRIRLYCALRGRVKRGSAVQDLGCSVEDLRRHIESQFQPGMTWENWSLPGWHIDHIKPLASFDLSKRNQLLEACHYTNLQPLWAEDNLRKDCLLRNQARKL